MSDSNHDHESTAQPLSILSEVMEDDMEVGTLRADYQNGLIDDKEVINFIEKYTSNTEGFHDFYLYALRDVFANSGLYASTLWVENPVTGNFVPVQSDNPLNVNNNKKNEKQDLEDDEQLENAPLIPKLDDKEMGTGKEKVLAVPPPPKLRNMDDLHSPDEWTQIRMEYRNFAFVKRSVYLVFQGLLGGFCVVTIFTAKTASSSSEFLVNYQPMAQEVRRYFYLLSTLSFLGSIDHLVTLADFYTASNPFLQNMSTNLLHSLEEHQKLSIVLGLFIIILYGISFITTLMMSSFDIQVFLKFGQDTSDNSWVPLALANKNFDADFEDWKNMEIIRAACSLLAWIGCCALLWRDISRFGKLWQNLRRVRQTAISWMKRARALEGTDELDKLSGAELRDVVSSLEVGLQRAKNALAFQEQEEYKKFS